MHSPGKESRQGDVLSRSQRVVARADSEELGVIRVQAVAANACADAEYSRPSTSNIKETQLEEIKVIGGTVEITPPFGQVAPDG